MERAEKCKKIRWLFGVWGETKIDFWDLLTFSYVSDVSMSHHIFFVMICLVQYDMFIIIFSLYKQKSSDRDSN